MAEPLEELKNIKSILASFPAQNDQLILFGASLEALRDIKDKTDRIHDKLTTLEVRFAELEKMPKRQQVNVTKIIERSPDALPPMPDPLGDHKIKPNPPIPLNPEQQILFVSDKRRQIVESALRQHGRLNPLQLAKIIGLSRTRCNEYLKEMEREGITQAVLEDKKKYYSIVA